MSSNQLPHKFTLGIIIARLTFIGTGPTDRWVCKWNGSSWNVLQNPENGPEGLPLKLSFKLTHSVCKQPCPCDIQNGGQWRKTLEHAAKYCVDFFPDVKHTCFSSSLHFFKDQLWLPEWCHIWCWKMFRKDENRGCLVTKFSTFRAVFCSAFQFLRRLTPFWISRSRKEPGDEDESQKHR